MLVVIIALRKKQYEKMMLPAIATLQNKIKKISILYK